MGSALAESSAKTGRPPKERIHRIYHEAAAVFLKKGYEATTLQDVAAAVGLTKAGLYHYIRSKEQLLFDILTYALDRIETEVLTPARATSAPAARIRLIASRYTYLVTADVQDFTLTIEQEVRGLSAEHHKIIHDRRRVFYDLVRETIEELQKTRVIPPLDASMATLSFFGAILWVAHWYRPNGRMSQAHVVSEIVDQTTTRLLRMKKT